MRILLISDYSTRTGGVEVYITQLRDQLHQAGHEVVLFSSSVGEDGLRTADIECWGSSQRHLNRLLQTFNPFSWLRLKEIVSEFRPQVAHLNLFLTQLSPSVLLALGDLPVVYTAHLYRMICPLGQKLLPNGAVCHQKAGLACLRNGCLPLSRWWLDMLQRRLLFHYIPYVDAIWANSQTTAGFLKESGVHVNRVQSYFLTTPFRDIPFPKGPAVGFVGRLVPEKGVDVLLRAFQRVLKRLPTARLLIAGDGKERIPLEKLCGQLGLQSSVDFLGYLPPERLDEFWRQIQVLAVPSIWAEPFGLVAPEAMAAGRAVVATLGGGLEESVVDGQTGFLVPPGEVDELSDRLLSLLVDSTKARAMGHRGLEMCLQKFDNNKILQEHIQGYEALRAEPNSSGDGLFYERKAEG